MLVVPKRLWERAPVEQAAWLALLLAESTPDTSFGKIGAAPTIRPARGAAAGDTTQVHWGKKR